MTKKNEYEIERERQQAANKKAMASLTSEQMQAIKQTHKALDDALSMLRECHDLYLSDINKLNDAFWSINHQFNLEE
tara:strand:- start:195 stop:425 length:231 start_codon:yes stop_codon:yes gene_type:complete